jgi:hypothetical protein
VLCNIEIFRGDEDKQLRRCETRGQLGTQETDVSIETESIGIRALSSHGLRMKVNESDSFIH